MNVEDFLKKLENQQPTVKERTPMTQTKSIDKIYLNFPGNFGRYQIFPMDNVLNDYPFVTLFNTREINLPRKTGSDENVKEYSAWIKLLPKDAYVMRDATNRIVSSLTASEEQLLHSAYRLHDELKEELDARNNREEYVIKLLRTRNYTLFHGLCLNKWSPDGGREPQKTNFTGLFVCTAKNFVQTVQNNINDKSIEEGGVDWLPSVYGRQLENRDGYLMFSINPDPNKAGYQVTATHVIGKTKQLADYRINQEDADLMLDPVANFLGWQANREEDVTDPTQRRLFNAPLIEEAIRYMSEQLAAIRLAKSKGMDLAEAVAITTQQALANQVVYAGKTYAATNDPMLADARGPESFAPTSDFSNNTDPFNTPPVAHIDPMTSAPTRPEGNFDDTFKSPFSEGFNQEF